MMNMGSSHISSIIFSKVKESFISEVKVSVVRVDAILFASALVSNTLQLLNIHVFDTLENGATELLVLSGV